MKPIYNQVPWWQHSPWFTPWTAAYYGSGLLAIWDNKCPFDLSWFESRSCQNTKTEAVYTLFLWKICHLAKTKKPSPTWSQQTTTPVRVLCLALNPYMLSTTLQLWNTTGLCTSQYYAVQDSPGLHIPVPMSFYCTFIFIIAEILYMSRKFSPNVFWHTL